MGRADYQRRAVMFSFSFSFLALADVRRLMFSALMWTNSPCDSGRHELAGLHFERLGRGTRFSAPWTVYGATIAVEPKYDSGCHGRAVQEASYRSPYHASGANAWLLSVMDLCST